jgi:hypothetical protein
LVACFFDFFRKIKKTGDQTKYFFVAALVTPPRRQKPAIPSFLFISPLIHPFCLNLLQVAFVAIFSLPFKIRDFEDIIEQFGEADAVDFSFVKLRAKALIEFHGDIFVIRPIDWHIVKIGERHRTDEFGDGKYAADRPGKLMFVTDDIFLIGYGHGDDGIFVQDDALAAEAAFEARIDGAVNEILFFIGNFLQKLLSLFNIYVASGAGANAAAVVVEVHVEVFRDFEDRLVGKIAGHRFTRNRFIFKKKMNSSHYSFDTLPAHFYEKIPAQVVKTAT